MDDRIPQSVLRDLGLPTDAVGRRLGSGHIHRTWRIDRPSGGVVLQRFNHLVFSAPELVVANAVVVAEHLVGKQTAGEYPLEVPRPLACTDGTYLMRDADGAAWRAMECVEGTRTVDVVTTAKQARTAARAFGAFCAAMGDLDPALEAGGLHVVIPRFHDLPWRMEALHAAAATDRLARAATAGTALRYCAEQQPLVDEVAALEARLPRRICHNDTKINNMLFDAVSDAARAVIDLDTCMPGYWMHDYGDMVRTFCSPEPEDSTRLGAVRVREDVFAALTEGFLASTGHLMQPVERESLWVGACSMCLMIGVRFLTDWLDGDRYFTADHPDHNLDRARNQFALHRDLTSRRAELARYL